MLDLIGEQSKLIAACYNDGTSQSKVTLTSARCNPLDCPASAAPPAGETSNQTQLARDCQALAAIQRAWWCSINTSGLGWSWWIQRMPARASAAHV
jgi:hypothetical protein